LAYSKTSNSSKTGYYETTLRESEWARNVWVVVLKSI